MMVIFIVVGGNSGKVELLLSHGNGSFFSEGIIDDFGRLSLGVISRDVNNDRYADIIIAAATDNSMNSPSGYLYYLSNTGESNCFNEMECEIISNISSAIGSGCLISIDMEKDGNIEIIVGIDDKIYLFNNKNSRYYPACLFDFSKVEEVFEDVSKGGITVGDFNDDGHKDFITGGIHGISRLFLNNHQYH